MFRYLSVIYIISFLFYIIFGHRFLRNIVYLEENKEYSKSFADIIFRSFYLCYIVLLYNSYYFYNPTKESYYNALLINIISLIAYTYKYGEEQMDGVFIHLLYSLPLLLFYRKKTDTGFGLFSVFTIILLVNYKYICNFLLNNLHIYFIELDYESCKKYCDYK